MADDEETLIARAEIGGVIFEKHRLSPEREAELNRTQVPWDQSGTWDPNHLEMGPIYGPALRPGCTFCGSPLITVGAMGPKGKAGVGMCEKCAVEVEKALGLVLDRLGEPRSDPGKIETQG